MAIIHGVRPEEIPRAFLYVHVIPRVPPLQWFERGQDDELAEAVAVDKGPAGEEFGQMVCVALFLREALGEVGAVVFRAGAVEGDSGGRNDSFLGKVVVNTVEEVVVCNGRALFGDAELDDEAVHGDPAGVVLVRHD